MLIRVEGATAGGGGRGKVGCGRGGVGTGIRQVLRRRGGVG